VNSPLWVAWVLALLVCKYCVVCVSTIRSGVAELSLCENVWQPAAVTNPGLCGGRRVWEEYLVCVRVWLPLLVSI
jgi:hypothetical protein